MNINPPRTNQDWRIYQDSLRLRKRSGKKNRAIFKISLFILILTGFVSLLRLFPFQESMSGVTLTVRAVADSASSLTASIGASLAGLFPGGNTPEAEPPVPKLDQEALKALIPPAVLNNLTERSFDVSGGSESYRVTTSMDMDLQGFLLSQFDRFGTISRGIPMYMGIVALTPSTGEVKAMAGYDNRNGELNPCLEVNFPAASIIKIVTAAAAIEKAGLTPETSLAFNGGKYTLYKSQLRERVNKHTNRLTLRSSFAQSVNPVFGKLGSNLLGKETLEEYAGAFGFNTEIGFEVPVNTSRFALTDKPYQWAEAASGFNRRTVITPLYGALIGATVANNGTMPVPTVVERVEDRTGRLLYTPERGGRTVIEKDTSSALKTLMAATIDSGTARKAFKRYKRDKVLSKLTMGGKTGSIGSREYKGVRYDWFVGFAQTGDLKKELAISVIVAHEKYIGIRASRYARMAFTRYFKRHFAMEKKRREVAEKTRTENNPAESGT